MRIGSFFGFVLEQQQKRMRGINMQSRTSFLPAFHLWADVMVRSSRSDATQTHARTHRTCSIIVGVVVVFVALTFMLIANGVTNIIHWIRIRNSILSWEFQSWNCTKQFHDYSLKIHKIGIAVRFFLLLLARCVVKKEKIHREKCKSPNVSMGVLLLLLFAFFPIRVNRILSIQRSEADLARAKVAWQHPTPESTNQHIH